MNKLFYRTYPEKLIASPIFHEASKDELKVFIALSNEKGQISAEQLAVISGCALSRCRAAITLFEEEGLLEKSESRFEDSLIEYEHGETSHFSDMEEERPLEVARAIKREGLNELLDECARILDKAAFSSTETAKIVSLVTNLSLSGEYVTTLLSFLKSTGKCTVTRLFKKAEELVGRGIDEYDSLEEYIRDRELPEYVWEFRRVFGIRGRQPSPSEKDYYKKWSEEFGYGANIVTLAYDKATLVGSPTSLAYIDKVLSAWHEAGCKTVSECEENSRVWKESKANVKKEPVTGRAKSKTAAPTPRYGDFDVEEAFRLALERSYGDEEK